MRGGAVFMFFFSWYILYYNIVVAVYSSRVRLLVVRGIIEMSATK